MKIAVAQLDLIVGAFQSNLKKIEEALDKAEKAGADLCITPELALSGYPPMDLLDRPEIFERTQRALQQTQSLTQNKNCALAVGHIAANPSSIGRRAFNRVTIFHQGKEVFKQDKTLLPTYDVFDEARYFEAAKEIRLWEWQGKKIAIAICEDLWSEDSTFDRMLYNRNPVDIYARSRPDLLISISASPYIYGKRARREQLHQTISDRIQAPLVYVNQVGATDEVLFDGASFVVAPGRSSIVGRLPLFQAGMGLFEHKGSDFSFMPQGSTEIAFDEPSEMEVLSLALVSGIKEYFDRTGFRTAILGLSGGIDSAVVCALAVKALGPGNVRGLAMPGPHSSDHSLKDAQQLAKNLGIELEILSIEDSYRYFQKHLVQNPERPELKSLADENLQARIRGLMVMSLANHYNSLALATSNKSEMAVGYSTLYGDMVGALAPIGDLFKSKVYELAQFINRHWIKCPIPQGSIDKAPSAELSPGQLDQDSLPPYAELDAFLEDYLEKKMTAAQLKKKFQIPVDDLIRRVEQSEYKRRQAPPVLKVSPTAFGIGRRVPVAKHWDDKA